VGALCIIILYIYKYTHMHVYLRKIYFKDKILIFIYNVNAIISKMIL